MIVPRAAEIDRDDMVDVFGGDCASLAADLTDVPVAFEDLLSYPFPRAAVLGFTHGVAYVVSLRGS